MIRMPITSVRKQNGAIDFMLESGGIFNFTFNDDTIVTHRGSGSRDRYILSNPEFHLMINSDAMYLTVNNDNISFLESIDISLINTLKNILKNDKLNIATAPHIGVLIEGDDITINDRNSISLTDFEDGEECVLIKHPNGNFTANGERCFVYHVESLQGWFDAGNTSEPLTRVPITQSMLQRFNYAKPVLATSAPAARKSRKARQSRNFSKTRQARKNIF